MDKWLFWRLVFLSLTGCAVPRPLPADLPVSKTSVSVAVDQIQQVGYQSSSGTSEQEAAPAPKIIPSSLCAAVPFQGTKELDLGALVQEVLARNPTLAQMSAAWQAAEARYPQAIALDDPSFAVTLGPASFGSNTVNGAYRFNIEQKYPFPGKRRLRGERALAEAHAAGSDVDDTQLQLIEAAKSAFFDYFLVQRSLVVNDDGLRLLQEFRKNAESRYKTGLVPQQDILQADVELGQQQEKRLELEQRRQIAVARINTLLNLPPDMILPPPPTEIGVADSLPEAAALRTLALERRPDLQALAARLAADQAALALANKEFYPDFTPFAMYDRFMGNNSETQPLATMIGVSVNLPVRRERRYAVLAEAQARLNQRRAEIERQVNQANFEVQQAHAQVSQSQKAVRLYETTVLPAADSNVKAAQTAYVTGKVGFLTLLEAERNVVGIRQHYYELVASYYIRLANLERVVGGNPSD